jgi:hypothetical protein
LSTIFEHAAEESGFDLDREDDQGWRGFIAAEGCSRGECGVEGQGRWTTNPPTRPTHDSAMSFDQP